MKHEPKLPLVPLSVQARKAIVAANERVAQNTRPLSLRRKLAYAQIAKARLAFQAGDYAKSREIAEQVAI